MVSVTGDQHANAKEAERIGFGRALPFHDVTEENLRESVMDLINSPKYVRRAQEHGRLLKDQVTKPLERSVWWIEFLVRNPDNNYYRSPVHDLEWYQYFLLDVGFFLLLVMAMVEITVFGAIWYLCCKRKKSEHIKTD